MKLLRYVCILTAVCVLSVTVGCGSTRTFTHVDGDTNTIRFVGFKCFLFLEIGGERFQANGDVFIMKDKVFKFRIYDNLLNKYVFSLVSFVGGTNLAIMPMDKVALRKQDPMLSYILTESLYYLFAPTNETMKKDPRIKEISVANKYIKAIIYSYNGRDFRIEAAKTMEDGMPARIKISDGGDWVIFDVVEYQPMDFPIEMEDCKLYEDNSYGNFIEWIGVIYARQT